MNGKPPSCEQVKTGKGRFAQATNKMWDLILRINKMENKHSEVNISNNNMRIKEYHQRKKLIKVNEAAYIVLTPTPTAGV